jgi:hypothetical protein
MQAWAESGIGAAGLAPMIAGLVLHVDTSRCRVVRQGECLTFTAHRLYEMAKECFESGGAGR